MAAAACLDIRTPVMLIRVDHSNAPAEKREAVQRLHTMTLSWDKLGHFAAKSCLQVAKESVLSHCFY
jgi:hypothetical protein